MAQHLACASKHQEDWTMYVRQIIFSDFHLVHKCNCTRMATLNALLHQFNSMISELSQSKLQAMCCVTGNDHARSILWLLWCWFLPQFYSEIIGKFWIIFLSNHWKILVAPLTKHQKSYMMHIFRFTFYLIKYSIQWIKKHCLYLSCYRQDQKSIKRWSSNLKHHYHDWTFSIFYLSVISFSIDLKGCSRWNFGAKTKSKK